MVCRIVGSTQPIAGRAESMSFAETLRTTGHGHICFSVDNVDAAVFQLQQKGVSAFIPPADYPNVGVRVGLVKDNNGNVIEFSGPLAN